jgi:predicted transcriptional regulator
LKPMSVKRSKLEQYIEILNTLNQKGPRKSTGILEEISNSHNFLKEHIDFLMKQGLVKQRNIGKQVVYRHTQRGIAVLRYFSKHLLESPNRQRVSA